MAECWRGVWVVRRIMPKGAILPFRKPIRCPKRDLELATLYFYGLGVPRDQAKAVEILQATTMNTDAVELLGRAYAFGIGVAPDREKAISYFQQAAEHGNASAMHELADRLQDSNRSEAYLLVQAFQKASPGRNLAGGQVTGIGWQWNVQARLDVGAPATTWQKWSIRKLTPGRLTARTI